MLPVHSKKTPCAAYPLMSRIGHSFFFPTYHDRSVSRKGNAFQDGSPLRRRLLRCSRQVLRGHGQEGSMALQGEQAPDRLRLRLLVPNLRYQEATRAGGFFHCVVLRYTYPTAISPGRMSASMPAGPVSVMRFGGEMMPPPFCAGAPL